MQFREIIPDAVDKDTNSATAANEEGMLPPIVVFAAKLDVDGHDCDFGDGDDEDYGDNGEEAEHVVVAGFVLPKALEDEKELDEDYRKGD